jgi:hypothetical protein
MTRTHLQSAWPAAVVLGGLGLLHLCLSPVGEPFKNGDETRHVMTGVFFRDALADLPESSADPRGYASRYYVQYPALGLIVWPPFFYAIEGLAMSLFGTGYTVARGVEYAFALVGGIYSYRLVLRTHGRGVAAVALALLGLAPLVFEYTGYVLLEVPTLALILGAVFHFERHLDTSWRRDAILACLLAALAALTRFDAVMLLPFVLTRLVMTRRFGLVLRWPVLVGLLLALALTVPYYLFTWKVYGSSLRHAATAGTGYQATSWLDPRNFYLYPSFIPSQIGWAATVSAAAGFGFSLWRERAQSGAYLAILLATFVTFVPFAEPEARHAIYWVPALAVFAARIPVWLARKKRLPGVALAAVVVGLVAWEGFGPFRETGWQNLYVCGTDAVADRVLSKTSGERPVLYDGQLNGAFIHAVRRRDPDRRFTVARADKLLYSVYSDPGGGYQEYAATDEQMTALIHRFDPEYLIVEEPQVYVRTAAGDRLRRLLRERPAEYALEDEVPFHSNYPNYAACRLLIYRKLRDNPARSPVTELPVLAIGGAVSTR